MSSQPQTRIAPAGAEDPDTRVSASRPVDAAPLLDASADETVSIELNFNAFADHVPPTQHARRVASATDPSVQDFADQILELATLRMELKRLTRECAGLRESVRARDMRLQVLQDKLRRSGDAAGTKEAIPAGVIARDGVLKEELSHTLDLLLANTKVTSPVEETPTVILAPLAPAVPAASSETKSASDAPKRRLIPVDHEGEPIPLSRDIMTIGRTRDKDICIPSRGVSRDHARLVMSTRSVTVFDMDSANGCFVNDEPVRRHKLRDNDVLRIGDRSYRFAEQ
jgi:FHA domain